MKVVLLLANCVNEALKACKEQVINVLEELEIDVDIYDLYTLPYFKGDEKSPIAALLAERVQQSRGVVILSSVHVLGIHGTVHSFFEHMSHYKESMYNKPLLSVTYSDFQGERKAAFEVLQAWTMLGGSDGGMGTLNSYTALDKGLELIEKQVELFYRNMKQDKEFIGSSEYYIYNKNEDQPGSIKQPVFTEKNINTESKGIVQNREVIENNNENYKSQIDLSTKEQNIQELAKLLRSQMGQEEGDNFTQIEMPTYNRPVQREFNNQGGVRLQNLPHYFIAQHDKNLSVTIKYTISDKEEVGYIMINQGDCSYEESAASQPHIEIIVTMDVLGQLLNKKLTYQKAFMIGKIKVKGNFGILAKIDQSFKAM